MEQSSLNSWRPRWNCKHGAVCSNRLAPSPCYRSVTAIHDHKSYRSAVCGTSGGPLALLSSCKFASTAGNAFVLTDVTTCNKVCSSTTQPSYCIWLLEMRIHHHNLDSLSMQEVIPAQGVGIQAFGACSKQGLLAYVTQVLHPCYLFHYCEFQHSQGMM